MAKLVVVVNDYPDFLTLMERLLARDGYRVEAACAQGRLGVRLRELRPALVVLDLVLEEPGRGWDILAEVRRDPALAPLPVILCTQDAFVGKERAVDLRLYREVAVLARPYAVSVLLALVRRLIGRPTLPGPSSQSIQI